MIEVRFFSTLREGRGKITQVPAQEASTAGDLLRRFENGALYQTSDRASAGDRASLHGGSSGHGDGEHILI